MVISIFQNKIGSLNNELNQSDQMFCTWLNVVSLANQYKQLIKPFAKEFQLNKQINNKKNCIGKFLLFSSTWNCEFVMGNHRWTFTPNSCEDLDDLKPKTNFKFDYKWNFQMEKGYSNLKTF